jgi:ribosomal protein S18 acetylase RimI-like enzyme
VSAYRFCRTDDIALLVDALNRCWLPDAPGEAPMTLAAFKRSIRDLQVWCSSCMVAFAGADPVGVLIGAKRPSGTLIHRIAVHPAHRRQGHGRHLLGSLGSKLAILGPPRIQVEVPEPLVPACELFRASGYVQEAVLTDYVWARLEDEAPSGPASPVVQRSLADLRRAETDLGGRFVIPVTVDDLEANGLLDDTRPQACWERSVDVLTARRSDIRGLAVASDEYIEAYVLYMDDGGIVSLRTLVEDDRGRLATLLSTLRARCPGALTFPKVHPDEIAKDVLEALGFRRAGQHRLYAARAHA